MDGHKQTRLVDAMTAQLLHHPADSGTTVLTPHRPGGVNLPRYIGVTAPPGQVTVAKLS